jgi:hypothetical protein
MRDHRATGWATGASISFGASSGLLNKKRFLFRAMIEKSRTLMRDFSFSLIEGHLHRPDGFL